MIITCEKCQSNFRLDDEKVKATGSKVRCSKCKHIFEVFMEPVEQEPASPAADQIPPEPSVEPEELTFEESLDFDLEDLELGADEWEGAPSEEALVSEAVSEEESVDSELEGLEEEKVFLEETDGSAESEELPEEPLAVDLEDSSPEEPLDVDLENSSPEEPEATEESPDLISEEGAEVSEETIEGMIPIDKEMGSESSGDAAMGADMEEIESPPDEEGEDLSSTVEEEGFTLEDIPDEGASTDEVESASQGEVEEEITSLEMKEMEEISFDEEFEESEVSEEESPDAALAPTPSQEKKRPSFLLLILLIGVSIVGGVYAAITFFEFEPFKSEFKIPYLNIVIGGKKSVQKDPGNLKIALLNVKGYFEDTKGAGFLFIIRGYVRNDYPKDRSFVRVKGLLYDKSGKIVKAKSVYCGNILTKTEMEDLSVEEINKKLLLQSGTNQSNVKISQGKMVSFMVVFEDIPSDLGEFSVEIEGSVAG